MVQLCDKLDKGKLPLYVGALGGHYVAEVKLDGERIRLKYKGGLLSLTNRRGMDVTEKYPELHSFTHPSDIFLDGEMCVLDDKGISQFNTGIAFRSHCQSAESINQAKALYPVTYVLFDILELGGVNLRSLPLKERRVVLETEFRKGVKPNCRLVEQSSDIMALWNRMISEGQEGIILKPLNSPYKEGNRGTWLKVKNIKEVDLIFTKYETHPKGIVLENTEGIRVNVNGNQHVEVLDKLVKLGSVEVTIRHLGETGNKRYRQPTFMKLVEKI
jgi:ATP-dependent DNA ligase